eukprot:GHVR01100399.1.p1 GENE.GHVR01100399.1~~GHVR01100399.1.p1  ORF type:complete len:175 (+),score=4.98 GHVR01100399.1:39-563(+)
MGRWVTVRTSGPPGVEISMARIISLMRGSLSFCSVHFMCLAQLSGNESSSCVRLVRLALLWSDSAAMPSRNAASRNNRFDTAPPVARAHATDSYVPFQAPTQAPTQALAKSAKRQLRLLRPGKSSRTAGRLIWADSQAGPASRGLSRGFLPKSAFTFSNCITLSIRRSRNSQVA